MNEFNENQGMDFNPKTMKYCKQCGKAIAKNAKACPNCGGKNKKPIYKSKLFIILVALIVIGAAVSALGGGEDSQPAASGDSAQKQEQQEQKEQEQKIEYTSYTVAELNEDLDKNAASAKDKYEGQYVSLEGELSNIDSDGAYIDIKDPYDEWDLIGIQCYIKSDEQLEKVKTLSTGDIITVKGKITDVGELMGYSLYIDKIKK